ncbi:hypothetical protein LY76DRAFT_574558 [Colletotrichum caudatum]|nr:hypothetical protein LY76DRAFT_574558 [Colletotrichum caudatum]
MLSAKKPGNPIAVTAQTMHATYLESPDQFSHSIDKLYGVTAGCFTATRGVNDLSSLNARLEALNSENPKGVSASESESVLKIYSDLLDEVIGLFGEDSQEAIDFECNLISDVRYICSWTDFENWCKRYIRRVRGRKVTDWGDWDKKRLCNVASTLWSLADFHWSTDNFDAYILCLEQCIHLYNYLAEEYGKFWACGDRAAEYRLELIEVLSELGRLEEASEVRLDMVGLRYLLPERSCG